MSDQAVLTRGGEGVSASLQERIRAFTAFYEQHAYLAYNLALRTTGDGEAGTRAVSRAFLAQLDDDPQGLLAAGIRTALEEAPPDPDVAAAGDPEAQALLAATVQLSPAERAALAANDLADAGPEEIGQALGIPAEQAANLLERARAGFAEALGVERDRADAAVADWMWAAPPNEIWEDLYPRFHRAVERRLRSGDADATLVLKAEAIRAPAKATRGARRRLRRGTGPGPAWARRLRPSVALPVAALVIAAAAVAATQLPRGGESGPAPGTSIAGPGFQPPGGEGVSARSANGERTKPHKPLTAELLDKLRLRELRQLRAYTKRQANRSLPARQRRAAARRIAAIERAARARLRAQQRREAALEREARARARSQAPAPPPPPRTERRSSPRRSDERRQEERSVPSGTPQTRDEAERTCLQDESTGQFVCPQ